MAFDSSRPRARPGAATSPSPICWSMRCASIARRNSDFACKLGAGKLHDDGLLFADIDGPPLSPNAISAAWSDYAKPIGMPEVTFHALRHTHASQLIDAGVDIVTISRRLGHAKPDITLRIYAHLFQKDDSKAAAAINAILK